MGITYISHIRMFAVDREPWGWVPCDGRLLEKDDHKPLFALIGYTYGRSPDGKQFAVPDLRDRMALGDSDAFPAGAAGGADGHKLTEAELPAHRHRVVGEDISPSPTAGHAPATDKALCNSDPMPLYVQTDPPPPPPPDPPDPDDPEEAAHAAAVPDPPGVVAMYEEAISPAGASAAHPNVQPYVAVAFYMNTDHHGLLPTRP